MSGKWTEKWPTKPGRHWFYGWPYGDTEETMSRKPIAPELNMVDVWKVSGGLTFVREGQFWSKKDGPIGMFCEADVPELPDVSGMASDRRASSAMPV